MRDQTIAAAGHAVPQSQSLAARALPALLALYCVASFAHFWHNAEFLMGYPNLPAWLTRVQVYAVWLGITAVGAVGCLLLRARWRRLGLAVLAVYECHDLVGSRGRSMGPGRRRGAARERSRPS
jgi:hypothetical protein